jgi:hypothetical protein
VKRRLKKPAYSIAGLRRSFARYLLKLMSIKEKEIFGGDA